MSALPVTGQDAAAMLRDLTEAVAEVAGRLLGLPPEDAGDRQKNTQGRGHEQAQCREAAVVMPDR